MHDARVKRQKTLTFLLVSIHLQRPESPKVGSLISSCEKLYFWKTRATNVSPAHRSGAFAQFRFYYELIADRRFSSVFAEVYGTRCSHPIAECGTTNVTSLKQQTQVSQFLFCFVFFSHISRSADFGCFPSFSVRLESVNVSLNNDNNFRGASQLCNSQNSDFWRFHAPFSNERMERFVRRV